MSPVSGKAASIEIERLHLLSVWQRDTLATLRPGLRVQVIKLGEDRGRRQGELRNGQEVGKGQIIDKLGLAPRRPDDGGPGLVNPTRAPRRRTGRAQARQRSRRASPTVPGLPRACRICGEVLQGSKRSYCDTWLLQHRREAVAPWQSSGPAALARLMAAGCDPTHGGEAAKKRAAKISLRKREAAKWDRHNNRPDAKEFAKKILPNLQGVPIEKMARAAGLSLMYCSLIRRGLYVPHPRHWETLMSVRHHQE